MDHTHLRFKLHKECFAIPVSQVLKILEYKSITSIPKAPPSLKGVLNWQGTMLPVVDLNMKLGFPETTIEKETCILVLEMKIGAEKTILGCIVDQVKEVFSIDTDRVIPSPSIGEKYQSDLIVGMYPAENEFIILLDFIKIFETDNSLQLSKSTFATPSNEVNNSL